MKNNSNKITKQCPQCQNTCEENDLFCNKCGYKFSKEDEKFFCSECGNEYNPKEDLFCKLCGNKLSKENNDIKICPECGVKNTSEAIYCGECGALLSKSNQNKITSKYTENNTDKEYMYNEQNKNTVNSNSTVYKCPYCGSQVEHYTKKCPHCGEWLSGVSHFGCGSFLMLITVIISIFMVVGGESISLPLVGEIAGIFLVIVAFLYFLPSLIADWRGHDSKFAIFLVNLLFGWSIIGWIIALIMSFTGRSR